MEKIGFKSRMINVMDDDRVKNDMTLLMIYARKTRDQFHEVGVVSEDVDFRDEEMSNEKKNDL